MRVSYSDGYVVALPEGHPFPMEKFPALRDILLRDGLLRPGDIGVPAPADWDQLRLVHTNQYLDTLRHGRMDRKAERRMGLPWSEQLVQRSRLAVGGTVQAARMALQDGIAANLAGGTHHAFPDHAEGFCVLNDMGVAIRLLRAEGHIERALVIDLDVHQGNGTAAVFAQDEASFTFSMHGERNYPFAKVASSLDVGLPDGTGDADYLAQLQTHLPAIFAAARPDLVFYLAGVDPLAGDRFGRLQLTEAGLRQRDRAVLSTIRQHDVPAVLLMSGGYAPTPQETARLHAITHHEAAAVFSLPSLHATSIFPTPP